MLIDCGMEQGNNVYKNAELPVSYSEIDYVFLTHAHIDHAGMLPWIYARGFKGKVIATYATVDLCSIMLKDPPCRPKGGRGSLYYEGCGGSPRPL